MWAWFVGIHNPKKEAGEIHAPKRGWGKSPKGGGEIHVPFWGRGFTLKKIGLCPWAWFVGIHAPKKGRGLSLKQIAVIVWNTIITMTMLVMG